MGEICCSEIFIVGDDEVEVEVEDKEYWVGWLIGWYVGCCNVSIGKCIVNF